MALATTCPQCKTSFKVVPDQLKLRRGLVRCGVCQHVFSGIDYLRYVDDAARAAQRVARDRGTGAVQAGAGREANVAAAATAADVAASARATGEAASAQGDAGAEAAPVASASPVDAPGPSTPALPEDPWAAAARIVHERSLDEATADDETRAGSGSPLSIDGDIARPTNAGAPADVPASLPLVREAGAPGAHDGPSAAAGSPDTSAPGAPRRAGAASTVDGAAAVDPGTAPVDGTTAPPPPGPPALPAPSRPGFDLDDLATRPAALPPWPPAGGPQTIIAPEGELKTAFFLPDTTFGEQADDADAPRAPSPDTRIRMARARLEASPPEGSPAEEAPRDGFPAAPPSTEPASGPSEPTDLARSAPRETHAERTPVAAGHEPLLGAPTLIAPSADVGPLPGLPLRPEIGDAHPLPSRAAEPDPAPAPLAQAAPPVLARTPRESASAVDYFTGSRRRTPSLGLALSPAAWIAAGLLALVLALQAIVGWRDAIAARVPLVAPTLSALLSPFGLTVGPPREIDALTIEAFELRASGTPNVLLLTAVLRNRSAHVVAYPAMELSLTDSTGVLIVRKAIPPETWLADPKALDAGLAAHSERPLRMLLEHGGQQPSGYSVALFYP